jgi:hypothetical protein
MTKNIKYTALLCAFSAFTFFGCAPGGGGGSSSDSGSNSAGSDNTVPVSQPVANLDPGSANTVYGVTIDQVSDVAGIVDSLSKLAFKPTARIVFDEGANAAFYSNAAAQIHNVSFVMGEILDSFYMKNITADAYLNRTKDFMNTLGNNVDIWEIGNEINGEWLGNSSDVVAKMNAAYGEVKARGKKAALTLYYNEGCYANASNEMFTWAQANVSADMKQNLDYVLISYYEDDCNGLQPDWPTVFHKLAQMFPNSKIGFGESGTKNTGSKAAFIQRYYDMVINEPNYIGGYFWWYFYQDCVPSTKPLWTTLNNAIQ